MTRLLTISVVAGLATSAYGGDCPGDCNGDGTANILDFVCFQGEWQAQTEKGDCDVNGLYNILDFVCFQGEWQDFANGGCDGGCDNGAPAQLDEDFESYALGDLCGQCGWDPWDLDAAVCAPIVDDLANSGTNSLRLTIASDMVQVFDIQDGQWTATAMTYVPSEATGAGFYIMLNTYEHLGTKDWSVQLSFDAGLGTVTAQDQAGELALLVKDEWVELRLEIDLDADTVDYYYNGEQFVFAGNWSDGFNTGIECIDLYSQSMDGMYYDDVTLLPAP